MINWYSCFAIFKSLPEASSIFLLSLRVCIQYIRQFFPLVFLLLHISWPPPPHCARLLMSQSLCRWRNRHLIWLCRFLLGDGCSHWSPFAPEVEMTPRKMLICTSAGAKRPGEDLIYIYLLSSFPIVLTLSLCRSRLVFITLVGGCVQSDLIINEYKNQSVLISLCKWTWALKMCVCVCVFESETKQ